MTALPPMRQHLAHPEDSLAESAFSDRVLAVDRLVTDLVLLEDSHTTAFADYVHEIAVIKLVSA